MAITMKKEYLVRYKDIARLLYKYGRSDLAKQVGLDEALGADNQAFNDKQVAQAEELADDLEALGPTFIKLGQLLSTRADLVPPAYLKALSRLQDNVKGFSYEEVDKTVSQELGVKVNRAFKEFDQKPLASASLGQVHRAVLHKGQQVVVKVQRPGVKEQITNDLAALREIAQFLDKHTDMGRRFRLESVLDELGAAMLLELDYRQEAKHLVMLRQNLAEFELLFVPQPFNDYTTSKILTMDYVSGTKLTEISPVVLTEINGEALCDELFAAYLKQILVDGFFHADPHPGNVLLTMDRRIALLDLGMVGHLSSDVQQDLIKLLLAISEGRGEDVADVALKLGRQNEDAKKQEFRMRVGQLVAQNRNVEMADVETGRVVMEVSRLASDCGIFLPSGLTMLGKTLLNLDRVARVLDPKFDPNASIRNHARDLMTRKMSNKVSTGTLFHSVLETTDFVQKLPDRMNKIFDLIANNQVGIRVDAIDEATLINGITKVANRITSGIIFAAMIVGAALIMRIPSRFMLFGYPALAIIFFLVAALGGLYLVYQAMFADPKDAKKNDSKEAR
ncbi:MAG: AarF/UbiB family protein [FCB group bacterium]|jgi:predicted unusual protein kinase regulating ubiquinone biosynthesis (AarF/ABC1/UbiB family)|nr:AarF/UbiB family protein [FCB group bacterium]